MFQSAQYLLILWIPICLLFFAVMPARRAAITATVLGGLFLPNAGFLLTGLPDYGKHSATNLGVLLGALIFDARRLIGFRPRWFDVPMCVWILSRIVSALMNDVGLYAGISEATGEILNSGCVYLVGRIYLDDLESLREFSLAILVAALVYLPLCLYEVVYSPSLEPMLYGTRLWSPQQATRYGLGYRPIVFLGQGLATGMWMSIGALVAYWNWSCGCYQRVLFIPARVVMAALMFGALMTKSVGAWVLLAMGLGALEIGKRTKSPLPMIALIVLPVLYIGVRAPNLWTGEILVRYADRWFGWERAQSLSYRLGCEDLLAAKAMQRPVWGWGGEGRNGVSNEQGQAMAVTDGYWIIVLGTMGLVGVAAMTAMYLLPAVLLIRKAPIQTWADPKIAPTAVLAVVIVLVMIDHLSNAFPNMLYYQAIGGVIGVTVSGSIGVRKREADELHALALELRAAGEDADAEKAYHRALAVYSEDAADGTDPAARDALAACLEGLADHLVASGHGDRAGRCFRDALAIRRELLDGFADDPDLLEAVATDLEGLGRSLGPGGGAAGLEVDELRSTAIEVWEQLAAGQPDEDGYRTKWADALNDLAWSIVARPGCEGEEAARAVALAGKATEVAPDHPPCWNTLGTALYYSGDNGAAVDALRRSVELGGGTGFDFFILSMAFARLGEYEAAAEGYRRGVGWMELNRPDHADLRRFRDEASALLGVYSGAAPS